jgi:uncharacterized protein (TIGR02117 family)
VRSVVRLLGWGLAALLLGAALYIVAALLLGALPRNSGFVETHDGVPVYVRTNGVHAELIVPSRHALHDWTAEFPAQHMPALPQPTEWIALGWGDRGFMLTTPTWADLRPGTALVALLGLGEGVMHVEYVETPQAYKVRRVRLSPEEYARLVAAIRASFARDAGGAVQKLGAPGYFGTDAFYQAVPRYTFWHTCNEWTRRVLAAAGVRTATWAPFDTAVMFHLPAEAKR